MSKTKKDLITFRLGKADECLDLARFSISKGYWNAAAGELYYTCFYYVLALFAKHDINSSTHSGVNTLFGLHFIKESKIDAKWGRLVKILFDKRQKGDYGDFMVLTEEEVVPFLNEVTEFEKIIKQMPED
jgi:uncharacterized protein (UPF0332 family)